MQGRLTLFARHAYNAGVMLNRLQLGLLLILALSGAHAAGVEVQA